MSDFSNKRNDISPKSKCLFKNQSLIRWGNNRHLFSTHAHSTLNLIHFSPLQSFWDCLFISSFRPSFVFNPFFMNIFRFPFIFFCLFYILDVAFLFASKRIFIIWSWEAKCVMTCIVRKSITQNISFHEALAIWYGRTERCLLKLRKITRRAWFEQRVVVRGWQSYPLSTKDSRIKDAA